MTLDTAPGYPPAIERVVETVLPTRHGPFRMLGYRDRLGTAHVALVRGLQAAAPRTGAPPLVRVHSECLTGDTFGSYRCDCGEQLDAALARISAEDRGVVIYVRGHEGRGIGLLAKLEAYALQDGGADTVDANVALGHPADARSYEQSALILADLGVRRIRLLSSNPAKAAALAALGIDVVERPSHFVDPRPENSGYLTTKHTRMGHDRPAEADVWRALTNGAVPGDADPGMAADILHRYGPLVAAGTPLTIGQLGQSLDGFIASRTGDAEFVTGPADREHLHRLRALVDAVVVGGSTVAADDCRLTVRAVEGRNPVRVVLDPRARIPAESQVLRDGAAPTLWLVGQEAAAPKQPGPGVEVVRLPADAGLAPGEVVTHLRTRGLRRVLVEGGGRLVSAFLAAGQLDRLYLTTAPILIGDGVPGLRFQGADALSGALSGPSRRFLLGADVCTELLLRRPGEDRPAPGG